MSYITLDILQSFATKFAAKITDIFAKKTDIPVIPDDAKFTDTVYVHPTSSGNKHIPSGGTSGQILVWSADGTAAWGADKNTTYSAMTGASTTADGTSGLVPKPLKGDANRYLRSDGTWAEFTEATTEDIDNIINGLFT